MKGVLVIDTAGPVVGVAYRNEHQQEYWEQRIVRGADGVLIPKIADIASRHDIGWVAVSVGPGAFTGLRVGVASALGFAFAKNCKVIPLSSLAIRAAIVRQEHTLAILDARKKRVYAQFFDARSIVPIPLGEALDIAIEDVSCPDEFYVVGEGVTQYGEFLRQKGANIPLDACRSPVLEAAEIAWNIRSTAISPAEVQLNYIRPPDAQVPKNLNNVVGVPQKKESL